MTRPLEVLVVEPNSAMRTSLRGVLALEDDVRVAGVAADMLSALRLADRAHADAALVDDRAATLGRSASADAIVALAKRLPVVVTGMGEAAAYTRPYREAGASGYWCKTANIEELTQLLRDAAGAPRRRAA